MTKEQNEKAVKKVLLEIKLKKILLIIIPIMMLLLLIYFLKNPFILDMVCFVFYLIGIIVFIILVLARKIR